MTHEDTSVKQGERHRDVPFRCPVARRPLDTDPYGADSQTVSSMCHRQTKWSQTDTDTTGCHGNNLSGTGRDLYITQILDEEIKRDDARVQ